MPHRSQYSVLFPVWPFLYKTAGQYYSIPDPPPDMSNRGIGDEDQLKSYTFRWQPYVSFPLSTVVIHSTLAPRSFKLLVMLTEMIIYFAE